MPEGVIGQSLDAQGQVLLRLSVLVDITRLWMSKRNYKKHTDKDIDDMVRAIREYGWTGPIVANMDGEVLAGHKRLLAATRMGLEKVPVVWVDFSKTKGVRFMLADNKLAENAQTDPVKLEENLRFIKEKGEDVSLTFYSQEELDDMLFGTDYDVPRELSLDAGELAAEIEEKPIMPDTWIATCPHCKGQFRLDSEGYVIEVIPLDGKKENEK